MIQIIPLNGLSSIFLSVVVLVIYVSSLYIFASNKNLPRDHPFTVKSRFKAVIVASIACCSLLVAASEPAKELQTVVPTSWIRNMGFTTSSLFATTFCPLLHICLLFLGPVVHDLWEARNPRVLFQNFIWSLQDCAQAVRWLIRGGENNNMPTSRVCDALIHIRNLVVGPWTEEIVFRAVVCYLLYFGGHSVASSAIISALVFGLAHVHHLIDHIVHSKVPLANAIASVAFQFSFTSVFGLYVAVVYMRTGSVFSAFFVHMFCNHMGFPAFGDMASGPTLRKSVVLGSLVFGLFSFIWFFNALLDPQLFGSIFFARVRG